MNKDAEKEVTRLSKLPHTGEDLLRLAMKWAYADAAKVARGYKLKQGPIPWMFREEIGKSIEQRLGKGG